MTEQEFTAIVNRPATPMERRVNGWMMADFVSAIIESRAAQYLERERVHQDLMARLGRKRAKPVLATCEGCGAPVAHASCDYCLRGVSRVEAA